jgi:hypothetical protein
MIAMEAKEQAERYAAKKSIAIDFDALLGYGTDGTVFVSDRNSAVKVFQRYESYSRELRAYQRLKERGIRYVDGLAVPILIDFDDKLLIVEMDIVQPPYLLDFGKAYTDEPPPFDNEQLAAYQVSLRDFFRKDDLPRVRKIYRILAGLGIIYLDAKPQNIRLRSDAAEQALPDDDWDAEPTYDLPDE